MEILNNLLSLIYRQPDALAGSYKAGHHRVSFPRRGQLVAVIPPEDTMDDFQACQVIRAIHAADDGIAFDHSLTRVYVQGFINPEDLEEQIS